MSSTTRAGFLIPAVSDFADETIYFNDNVTKYEAELPIVMAGSLPSSGNYAGRIRAIDTAAVTSPPQPEYPFDGYFHNGTSWVRLGSAGTRRNCTRKLPGNGSSLPATTGVEVFQPSPIPAFSVVTVAAGQVLKFCCSYNIKWYSPSGQSLRLVGALNLFIDPNSSTQPTPITPGAIHLSDPIVYSDDYYAGNNLVGQGDGRFESFYSEFFYLATTTRTVGVSAYLSATTVNNNGVNDFIGIYDPAGASLPQPGVSIGIGANQFIIEACGTWSA